MRRSYFWPTMRKDVRKILSDCPTCELNKARQNTAHGLFSAMPVHAPRSRWCMDFQGQGTALTGETEALALIDPTSRYVVVIPLLNREAQTWIQPFLDRIVFTFGAPSTLHSDAAPEFLSEALALLAKAAGMKTMPPPNASTKRTASPSPETSSLPSAMTQPALSTSPRSLSSLLRLSRFSTWAPPRSFLQMPSSSHAGMKLLATTFFCLGRYLYLKIMFSSLNTAAPSTSKTFTPF